MRLDERWVWDDGFCDLIWFDNRIIINDKNFSEKKRKKEKEKS